MACGLHEKYKHGITCCAVKSTVKVVVIAMREEGGDHEMNQ